MKACFGGLFSVAFFQGGVDQLSTDLLALNAWTDAPYYFYKRASEGVAALGI